MLPLEAYLLERDRPCRRPAMRQRWRDLLFLHYPIAPDVLRPLLPSELGIDTYPDESGNEMAWIGLVPFRMEGVRLNGIPPFPGHGAFPETNVRTYVHLRGRPAVWFFSLDAASGLACRTARRFFHLPYWEATMSVARKGDFLAYRSQRRVGTAALTIETHVSGTPAPASPGTLEFFLLERYLLFSTDGRSWYGGSVHHPPYQAREAETIACNQSLLQAAGIPEDPFRHRMFSEGVDVAVGPLEKMNI